MYITPRSLTVEERRAVGQCLDIRDGQKIITLLTERLKNDTSQREKRQEKEVEDVKDSQESSDNGCLVVDGKL